MVHIGNSWDDILADEFKKEYYLKLREFLKYEYSHFTVYPDMHDIFNSLKYTPYENVKAVIIGQDPYHGPGQAHGLCFSVKVGVNPPPSLQNIFKEIHDDLGVPVPTAFILWGGNAKAKAPLITNPIHAVFKAAHPSPLSAYNGFFGCRHFSKVNDFLVSNNIQPIDWTISNK